jgi:tRNA A-37 threonylcarbamoyl transferase component Bud32/tetratricopeptide (TPR) repeat protein
MAYPDAHDHAHLNATTEREASEGAPGATANLEGSGRKTAGLNRGRAHTGGKVPPTVEMAPGSSASPGVETKGAREAAGAGGGKWEDDQRWAGESDNELRERAREWIGEYELIETLGRGGMGIVFKARQVSLNRLVALKVIKDAEFASAHDLRRFQNEAEAVAQLDHPHVVPIYDVGEHAGRRYFSMKLIAGTSLDKRLADFRAHPRAAAGLVSAVAEAVHHAHERGILHRDLKPANILLDERGEPHVTDFGLAKRITTDSQLTHSGALLGTPLYMSPEQAEGSKVANTTATDVYGLGSILYALLAGRPPFVTSNLAEALDLVRQRAPEPPTRHNRDVPRDLEVICLKCLEKEPKGRYVSALAVAEDLTRWLQGVPIAARPAGLALRIQMWCRRNPLPAALAGMLALAVVAGFAGVTWKWREADRERIKAATINELLTKRLLAQASPEFQPRGADVTVGELLDRASAQLGGWLDGEPEVEAALRETIGGAYLALAEYAKAERHLSAAVDLFSRTVGPEGRDTLRAVNLQAALLDETGRRAEAEPLCRGNLAACRRVLRRGDELTLDASERLGLVLWHCGNVDEAEAELRRNLDDRKQFLKPDHPDTLRSMYELSRLVRERGNYNEAERLAYQYAHDIRCARGPNHPDNISALSNQGDLYRDQGKHALAERAYQQAVAEAKRILGATHPATVAAAERHARLLRELGR